jgi:hypothetical protein
MKNNKKSVSLFMLCLTSLTVALGQSTINPDYQSKNHNGCELKQIEVADKYTIVSMEFTGNSDDAWCNLQPGVYIQDANGDNHYNMIKAEGVPLSPEKKHVKAGEKVSFKIYFPKIDKDIKMIDIIERSGTNSENSFNFFGVDLFKSRPASDELKLVSLAPDAPSAFAGREEFFLSAMMTQLKSSSFVEDMAVLAKRYYDALLKAGFNQDQALKIVTSGSIFPGAK